MRIYFYPIVFGGAKFIYEQGILSKVRDILNESQVTNRYSQFIDKKFINPYYSNDRGVIPISGTDHRRGDLWRQFPARCLVPIKLDFSPAFLGLIFTGSMGARTSSVRLGAERVFERNSSIF